MAVQAADFGHAQPLQQPAGGQIGGLRLGKQAGQLQVVQRVVDHPCQRLGGQPLAPDGGREQEGQLFVALGLLDMLRKNDQADMLSVPAGQTDQAAAPQGGLR